MCLDYIIFNVFRTTANTKNQFHQTEYLHTFAFVISQRIMNL